MLKFLGFTFVYFFAYICLQFQVPTDLAVDQVDNYIFWTDVKLNRLERSNLDGSQRQVLISDGIFDPLALIAVQDQFVYWAVRKSDTIYRVNKLNGNDLQIVKENAKHLSSLISVNVLQDITNPCQGKIY